MSLLSQSKELGIEGYIQEIELEKLAHLATGKEVLEVGAFCGLSAWGMSSTAKSVTSVDTFKAHDNGVTQLEEFNTLDRYMKAVVGRTNVTWHIGTSVEWAEKLGDYDMIFIDALHDYENGKADIAAWWPHVRPGGIIIFHDYGPSFPGLQQAIDESFGSPARDTTCCSLRWVQKPLSS